MSSHDHDPEYTHRCPNCGNEWSHDCVSCAELTTIVGVRHRHFTHYCHCCRHMWKPTILDKIVEVL
jgi:hypothetical protein